MADDKVNAPRPEDKQVADLGCGFGWSSQCMREHGAASVRGFDLSRNMIARAKADTADNGIDYRVADLKALELPRAGFDLVYSALAFHYIKDFERLVRMIYVALVDGGDLVFTIEHPIFMAAAHPHWIVDEGGRKTWPVNGYSVEGERRTDWFTKGFLTYHRTMATTLNALIKAGFALHQLNEFAPTRDQIAEAPQLAEKLERPMMLLISASKPRSP